MHGSVIFRLERSGRYSNYRDGENVLVWSGVKRMREAPKQQHIFLIKIAKKSRLGNNYEVNVKLLQEKFPYNILFCVEGITDFSKWHKCNGATPKTKHYQ